MSARRGIAPVRGGRSEALAEPAKKARPLAALADVAKLIGRSDAPQLKLRLTAALALTIGGKALGVLAPLLLGAAVNRLAARSSPEAALGLGFAALAIGWAVIRFASIAAPQVRDMVFNKVAQAAWRRAAADTFAHALSLSIDYHQSKRTGSLARTVDRGARAVDYLLRLLAFNLAPTVLELILAAAVLAKAYDWRFAAIAVVTVVIYTVFTFSISNWRVDIRRAMNEADNEASGRAVDALLNYETVKAFGAETRAAGGYEEALQVYGQASIRANNSLALLNIVQSAIMSIGLGFMAVIAGLEAVAGRMGPGDVTASVLILTSLYQPLSFLGFAYREVRQSFIDMEAMGALMQETSGIDDAPGAVDIPAGDPKGAEVVFDLVSYRHDARTQGLEDVSFRAAPGTTVAFVGPSGAGKTTMARLALRLIDPQSGRVMIDGVDLKQARQASVRRTTALVPQDVALFNTSLRSNLNFARPDADEAAIWAAAEAAELGDFIRSLPDGLETAVGERGLKLSGGERQRVGIARALLADPRVLVLDEATSALDSRTEQAIQATLRKARVGRTTLVVAHRLSTIADADEILVLKAGRIVERGNHSALLASNGEYAALWRKQVRETPRRALKSEGVEEA